MNSDRKIKKIILKQEMLMLDLDEYSERDIVYLAEFNQDFTDEIQYIQSLQQEASASQAPIESMAGHVDLRHLKSLHKKLAMATHPDLNPDSDEEFKQIQAAYEAGDGATLIKHALDLKLDIEMSSEDLQEVEKDIDLQADALEQKKNSVRWAWCLSDKNEELKARCRHLMGIDEAEYQAWLEKKS